MAEHWDGTSWSVQPAPYNYLASYLFGASCPSEQFCVAVGWQYYEQPTTLAEQWDGAKWSIQATPPPEAAQARHGSFLNVSCPSIRTCTAVGQSNLNATTATLAERWRAG